MGTVKTNRTEGENNTRQDSDPVHWPSSPHYRNSRYVFHDRYAVQSWSRGVYESIVDRDSNFQLPEWWYIHVVDDVSDITVLIRVER